MGNKHSANIQQNLTNLAAPSLKERAGGEAIGKFILIGDHKQLPAVVQQSDTEVLVEDETVKAIHLNSCANSLFERLILTERAAGRTDFIGTLHKQGRMHPDIADFANRKFYAREQLECVPLAHQLEQTLAYNETSEDETDNVLKAHRMIFHPFKAVSTTEYFRKGKHGRGAYHYRPAKTFIPTTRQKLRPTEVCWCHCALPQSDCND